MFNDSTIKNEEDFIREIRDTAKYRFPRFRYFLCIFVPITLIMGFFLFIVFEVEKSKAFETAKIESKTELEAMREIIISDLNDAVSDLLFLQYIMQHSTTNDPKRMRPLIDFLKSKKGYDQLRVIDLKGHETLRLNNHNDNIEVVAKDKLQDKSRRAYFKETIKLPPNTVYISPLSFNIENGAIEIPHKPVMRLGVPIFQDGSKPTGILVLNYLGKRIISDSMTVTGDNKNQHTIIFFGEDAQPIFSYTYPNTKLSRSGYAPKTLEDEVNYIKHLSHVNPSDQLLYNYTESENDVKQVIGVSPEGVSKSSTNLNLKNITSSKGSLLKAMHVIPLSTIDSKATSRLNDLFIFFIIGEIIFFAIAIWGGCILAKKKEMDTEIKAAAISDPLTEIYNRRFGMLLLKHRLTEATRKNSAVSIFVVDINNLKGINDKHGHAAGDLLIKTVANRIDRGIRDYDIFCRTGGDEFFIAFSDMDLKQAKSVLTRIRNEINHDFSAEFPPYGIDFAFGGIQSDQVDDISLKSLLEQADQKMYQDKIARKLDNK